MPNGPEVKLMSDYSCDWPLWPRGSLPDASAESLGLGEELTRILLELQDLFESGFHWEHGWRLSEDEERYARLAVDAWYRLQRELGDRGITVTIELWPVHDREIWPWLRRAGVVAPDPAPHG